MTYASFQTLWQMTVSHGQSTGWPEGSTDLFTHRPEAYSSDSGGCVDRCTWLWLHLNLYDFTWPNLQPGLWRSRGGGIFLNSWPILPPVHSPPPYPRSMQKRVPWWWSFRFAFRSVRIHIICKKVYGINKYKHPKNKNMFSITEGAAYHLQVDSLQISVQAARPRMCIYFLSL